MKYTIVIIFFALISIGLFAQLPDFEWANQCGNPPNTTDTKTVLASGPDGDFYLSGEFLDTAQFGNKILVSAGGTDIFLVKHNAQGTVSWSNRIGAADYDFVQNIITDDEGNVIVTGYFYGTTQIGQDEYTAYGSQDLFIAKFNSGGDFLWSYRAGGPMADYITGLALDADQNLAITGYFYDAITFGDTTIPALSSSDIFLAKFNPGGELQWVTSAGGSSSDQARAAGIDPDGNILLTGSFYYDITFGDTTLSTINPVGAFIAKYFPDGQLDQAFQLDGTYLTPEIFVTAGQNGDFYISGNFSEQLIFGGKTFDAGQFNQDIFIAKYNASCDLQWAKHAFSFGSDQVIGIDTDPYNNLYLTGHYLDSIHFDMLTLPYTLCCGSREIFIVSYSTTGDLLWGEQISGTRANVQSLEMNLQGELLLSGLFTEEVNLGHLKLSNFDGFQNYVTCLQTEIYTSISQSVNNSAVRIFPNPAKERIHLMNFGIVNQYNYLIYNLNGKTVGSGNITDGSFIEVGFLPAGQYLLKLIAPEANTSSSYLFIKQ
jgi:hypothetical protein